MSAATVDTVYWDVRPWYPTPPVRIGRARIVSTSAVGNRTRGSETRHTTGYQTNDACPLAHASPRRYGSTGEERSFRTSLVVHRVEYRRVFGSTIPFSGHAPCRRIFHFFFFFEAEEHSAFGIFRERFFLNLPPPPRIVFCVSRRNRTRETHSRQQTYRRYFATDKRAYWSSRRLLLFVRPTRN